MSSYKVKKFISTNGEDLQNEIKSWIESRRHVNMLSINVWYGQGHHYGIIVYTENKYEL